MNKTDKWQLFVFVILIVLLLAAKIIKDSLIENNGMYVIGRLIESSYEGGDTGWLHYFEYCYKGIKRVTAVGGPVGERVLKDSAIILKISIKNPGLSFEIDGVRVPECYRHKGTICESWSAIPIKCEKGNSGNR